MVLKDDYIFGIVDYLGEQHIITGHDIKFLIKQRLMAKNFLEKYFDKKLEFKTKQELIEIIRENKK